MKYAIKTEHKKGEAVVPTILNEDQIMNLNLTNYEEDDIDIELECYGDIEGLNFCKACYLIDFTKKTMVRYVGFEVKGSLSKRKRVIGEMGFNYPYRMLSGDYNNYNKGGLIEW